MISSFSLVNKNLTNCYSDYVSLAKSKPPKMRIIFYHTGLLAHSTRPAGILQQQTKFQFFSTIFGIPCQNHRINLLIVVT